MTLAALYLNADNMTRSQSDGVSLVDGDRLVYLVQLPTQHAPQSIA